MKVLITGATGFIGKALSAELLRLGHEPIKLHRGEPRTGIRTWDVDEGWVDPGALDGVDAVVHLAGRPITPPFTQAKKQSIIESRRRGTALIAEAVAASKPRVFVSGSAIGFYGSRGDAVLTEESAAGEGFLSEVVQEWEAATQPAADAGVRRVNIRTALVLGPGGGLLPLTALPFRLFVGGPLGGGQQWWSWISLVDEVRAIIHCIETETIAGPVNLAAPRPVTNREFSETLGRVLGRPSWLNIPAFMMRLALGSDAANDLVLASQRVVPAKLTVAGFSFEHPRLEDALRYALAVA